MLARLPLGVKHALDGTLSVRCESVRELGVDPAPSHYNSHGKGMKRPEFIARQSRCPSGFLGRLIARVMAAETFAANDRVLELLKIESCDRILEVGFGHGRTVARASALAHQGLVAGVDASAEMFRMATRRCRKQIREKRVELQIASSRQIPYPGAFFDKAYAVHTLYFWESPMKDLREIRRVLKAGRVFVLGFRPRDAEVLAQYPASVYRFYSREEVQALLLESGFAAVEFHGSTDPGSKMLFAGAR